MERELLWQVATQVIVAFGASALALAILGWLAKSLVSHLLDKDVEKHRVLLAKELEAHRIALQTENDRTLTLYKAELDRLSEEHKIRFAQLHAKVFVTIARLYRLLVHAHWAMQNYIKAFVPAGDLSEEERGKKAGEALNQLISFFREHEIYFDEETSTQIEKFIDEMRDIFIDFQHRDGKTDVKTWKAVGDKMKADVATIKGKLRDTFREKIGVTKKSA